MLYCAATENGYEYISHNSINIFIPTFGKDVDGNDIIVEPAKATIGDFLSLAMAAIVAYYAKKEKNAPIKDDYILYDATPQERNDLITAIVELRSQWYAVPKVVEETLKKESEGVKGNNRKNG